MKNSLTLRAAFLLPLLLIPAAGLAQQPAAQLALPDSTAAALELQEGLDEVLAGRDRADSERLLTA